MCVLFGEFIDFYKVCGVCDLSRFTGVCWVGGGHIIHGLVGKLSFLFNSNNPLFHF